MARVTGIDEARANIKKVLENVKAGNEKAQDAVAAATLAESQANTPVLTGKLRNSEVIESEPLHRFIGTNVDYSIHVHEGTSRMPARPFLTNAMEATKGTYVQEALRI